MFSVYFDTLLVICVCFISTANQQSESVDSSNDLIAQLHEGARRKVGINKIADFVKRIPDFSSAGKRDRQWLDSIPIDDDPAQRTKLPERGEITEMVFWWVHPGDPNDRKVVGIVYTRGKKVIFFYGVVGLP